MLGSGRPAVDGHKKTVVNLLLYRYELSTTKEEP